MLTAKRDRTSSRLSTTGEGGKRRGAEKVEREVGGNGPCIKRGIREEAGEE